MSQDYLWIDLPSLDRVEVRLPAERLWAILDELRAGFESAAAGAWITLDGHAADDSHMRRVQWVPASSSVAAFFDSKAVPPDGSEPAQLRLIGEDL